MAKKKKANAVSELQKAKKIINSVADEIRKMKVEAKADGDVKWAMSTEFEEVVYELNEIADATDDIKSSKRSKEGALDNLFRIAEEKARDFFKNRLKQKKYEGEKIEAGYRVVNRKVVTGEPDDEFMEIVKKPNTKAIDAYIEATKSEKNPEGKLPVGIDLKTFEYIRFKNVKDE